MLHWLHFSIFFERAKKKPIIPLVGHTVTTLWETWHQTEVGLPAGNGPGVIVKSGEGRSCLRVLLHTRFLPSTLSCKWLTQEALTFVFYLVNFWSLAPGLVGGDKSFKITPSGFVSTSTSLKIVHTSLTEKGAPCRPSVSFSLRFLTNLDYQVVPPSHAVPQRSKNPSLRRISALLLAANFFPSRGWTRSERNPVDTLSNDRAFFFTILPPSKRERRLLVRSQTRKRFERAVSSFLNWLGQTSQASPHTFDDLDEAVGNWSDVLYQEGDSTGSAGDGISGLQYFLSLLSRPSPFLEGPWSLA